MPFVRSKDEVKSAKELAELAGRSAQTGINWINRSDWPFGKPPWPRTKTPEMLRWVAEHLRPPRPAGMSVEEPADDSVNPSNVLKLKYAKLRQEVRRLHAMADQAETALAKERSQLLDASGVEQEWAGIGNVVRNGFQNLASQVIPLALSHGMPNEAAPEFQSQIEELIHGILRRLGGSINQTESRQTRDSVAPHDS
jgi:hypothetical protein